MLLANHNIGDQFDQRIRATLEIRRAFCPICGASVRAHCGDFITWHWEHESLSECDPWRKGETEWHLNWKSKFPNRCIERTITINGITHRADVLVKERVIEFQHSSISAEEIRERENFYGRWYNKMTWVFDCREAYKARRLRLTREFQMDKPPGTGYGYRWKYGCNVGVVKTNLIFDTGDFLFKRMKGNGYSGYGYITNTLDLLIQRLNGVKEI